MSFKEMAFISLSDIIVGRAEMAMPQGMNQQDMRMVCASYCNGKNLNGMGVSCNCFHLDPPSTCVVGFLPLETAYQNQVNVPGSKEVVYYDANLPSKHLCE